nr:hypothetical protein [Tanacetum cinerariifolium]
MMQLVPVEDVYVQALQVKHPIIDWKVHSEGERTYWQIMRLGGSTACYQFFVDLLRQLDREDLNQLWALVKEYLTIRPASNDKEMELWVELKRMYEPDPEDQLWTLTQNYMYAPVECKLYDLSGVHHVTAKDKEIFMLVEKDYPLRRGLALVMISYRLQVENHSQMAEDLIKKIYNIANTPRKQKQPRPKVVFEDDSTCTTKGYGSIKCNGIVFTKGESINVQDLENNLYWEFRKFTSQDGESLESYYSSRANQDNSPRINRNARYENQRIGNAVGAKETVARECQNPKRAKDATYHREKMLLCKQEEAGIQLNAEQADWRDDTNDDELEDQEQEAHYMYMAQLQKVSPNAADSGPIFDDEPNHKDNV